MNKGLIQVIPALLLAILLGGCIKSPETSTAPAIPAPTQTPAGSDMPTVTAAPQYSAVPEITLPPEASIPAVDEGVEQREAFKKMRTENGEWIYYADWKRMYCIEDDYECPLKRIKKDGSGDTDLGITGFMFTVVGKHVYVGRNHVFGDFGHWDTVRMDLDGSNKKDMPYSDMSIRVFGDRIYFKSWNESVLYAADSACEQVKKYDINLPDQQAINDKLKNIDPVYMLSFHDVKNGWIYFHYELVDTGGSFFYEGDYRVSLEGTTVEKTNAGTFNEELISLYNE